MESLINLYQRKKWKVGGSYTGFKRRNVDLFCFFFIEDSVRRPKSLVKSKPSELDGADEKMLLEEEKPKLGPSSCEETKKDLENEKQNGDAILSIGELYFKF